MSSIEDTLKKLKEKHLDKNNENKEHDHIPESLKGAIVNSEKFNEFIKKSEIRDMKTGKKANVKGFILVNALLVVIVIFTVIYFLNNESKRLIGEAKITQVQSSVPSNGRPYDPNYKAPMNTPSQGATGDNTASKNTGGESKNMVAPSDNKQEDTKKLAPFPLGGKVVEQNNINEDNATPVNTKPVDVKVANNTNNQQATNNNDNKTYKSNEKNTFYGFFGIPLSHPVENTDNVTSKQTTSTNKEEVKKYTNQNNPLIAVELARDNSLKNSNNKVEKNKINNKSVNNKVITNNNEPLDKNYNKNLKKRKNINNNNMLPLDGNTVESVNEKLNSKNIQNQNKKQNNNYGIKEFLYLTDQNNQFDKYSTLKFILEKNKPIDKNNNTKLLSNSEIILYNKYINYGNEAITRGTYEYAIEYFTKALEISKDDNLIGTTVLMFLENKNPNYAFQTIVTNGLQNTRILTATIIDMANNQYFLEASKVVEYAKTLEPSYDIYFATGYLYNVQNINDLALKFYDYSLELNPDFAISLFFKAKILEKIDKNSRAQAIEIYKQIINMKNVEKKLRDIATSRYNALNGNK